MERWQVITLGVATLLFAWFTWWSTLKDRRYHGSYRFFAFMTVVTLVVLDIPLWFHDPASPLQIAAWTLLALAVYVVTHGVILLKVRGKPRDGLEHSTELVSNGPYRFIRHPMYCSLFLMAVGLLLKSPTLVNALLLGVNLIAVVATAKGEETEMLAEFGQPYREYMARTKMIVPFVL